jgi:Fic family protein
LVASGANIQPELAEFPRFSGTRPRYVTLVYISLAVCPFFVIFVTYLILSGACIPLANRRRHMEFDSTRPFDLPLLPPQVNFMHEQFVDVLLKTRTELGELNGYSHSLPNPLLLLSPAIIRESVASSGIENIITSMEEALQAQLFPEAEQKRPDKEVLRYRDAIMWGFENLKKIPISTRLILGIQKKLLPDQSPGYRRTQNRIVNSTTGAVVYTPPPANELPRLLSNWEQFVNNNEDGIDPLVKAATAHYQFEAIHPFGDGNGRTGRILMVLQLIQQKLLSHPILYVSGYINKNRSEYYRLLQGVRAEEGWYDLILFMLKAFHQQAQETKTTLFKVMDLLERTRKHIKERHRKIYSAELVEAIFALPIITPVNLGKKLDVNYRTASRYLVQLSEGKVLRESYVGKYHLYANEPLLKLFRT